jgi:hypothetical protein
MCHPALRNIRGTVAIRWLLSTDRVLRHLHNDGCPALASTVPQKMLHLEYAIEELACRIFVLPRANGIACIALAMSMQCLSASGKW